MKIPKINFATLSRFTIVFAIVVLLVNKFKFNSEILGYLSLALALLSMVFMGIFIFQFKKGAFDNNMKLVVETNVDKALADGVISKEQAEAIPKRVVLNANDLLLNLIFNLGIENHFDLIPVDILKESLPQVPSGQLMRLYEQSRDISDDLNDYFRSQKFLNKADVILKADEIKKYLKEKYPWMAPETLKNTYDYFFLGIGNG